MFRHNEIRRSLIGGIVIAAASCPAVAQAKFAQDPPIAAAQAVSGVPTSTAVQQTTSAANSGFSWDDAGIGAAGTVLLMGAGAGAAGAARRRRTRPVVG
jgi:hypothetical protein